ncbi:MAG: hypothetical protein ACFCU3_08680 [Verrucomicrobiales bacterium]
MNQVAQAEFPDQSDCFPVGADWLRANLHPQPKAVREFKCGGNRSDHL